MKTQYTFAGWNTKADGTGTSYAPGATFTLTGDVILYAQWQGYIFYDYNRGNANDLDISNAFDSSWTTNGTKKTKTIEGVTITYDTAQGTFTLDGTTNPRPANTGESLEFLRVTLPANANGYYGSFEYVGGHMPQTGNTPTVQFLNSVNDDWLFTVDAKYLDATGFTGNDWQDSLVYLRDGNEDGFKTGRKDAMFATINLYCDGDCNDQRTYDNYTFRIRIGNLGQTAITTQPTYGTLPEPTREGFTFDGWYDAETGGSPVTASTALGSKDSRTIYAHWKLDDVNVFSSTGGVIGNIRASGVNLRSADGQSAAFGTFTFDNDSQSLTYTPNGKVATAVDTISITTVDGDTANLNIIPAAVVYFDDSDTALFKYSGTWSGDVAAPAAQAIHTAKASDAFVFGDDIDGDAVYVGGKAKTARAWYGYDLKTTNGKIDYTAIPSVTFTFKGTGFDVISAVSSQAATISYTLTGPFGTNGAQKTSNFIVDTYFGYILQDGRWVATPNSTDAYYRSPVIHRDGLPYGEYTVSIGAFYNSYFARTHGAKDYYDFIFDGVRIYDPANGVNAKSGAIYAAYQTIGQSDWTEQTLRTAVDQLKDKDGNAAKVLIEGQSLDYATYAKACPENEIWLGQGGNISIRVNSAAAKVWLSVACVKGDGTTATFNSKNAAVGYGTQYVDLVEAKTADGIVTITNTGAGILSLRNIRYVAPTGEDPIVTPTTAAQTGRISLFMRAHAADEEFTILLPFTDEELNEHLEALAAPPAEDPTEAPTQPAIEPTEEPTQPAVEPTQPSVEPTDPAVEPTQPAVEPTEPAVEPTEPKTDASAHTDDDANGTICGYCGKRHPRTFWGSLVRLIHAVLYFFKTVFGLVK